MGNDIDVPTTSAIISTGSYGDREYTAIWSPKVYDIAYELNGGVVEGGNPDTYTVESPQITLKNPTKEGHVFEGWTGTDISSLSTGVIIKSGSYGNRSYVANWRAI